MHASCQQLLRAFSWMTSGGLEQPYIRKLSVQLSNLTVAPLQTLGDTLSTTVKATPCTIRSRIVSASLSRSVRDVIKRLLTQESMTMNQSVPLHPGSPYEAFADRGALVFPPPSGVETERFPGSVVQLPDGKIFAAFMAPGLQLELWRFTADGKPDQSYGNGGGLQMPDSGFFSVTDVAILAEGKVLVYGLGREQTTVRLMCVTSEGVLEPDFGDGGFAWAPVPIGMLTTARIALLPDGRVIGAGHGPYSSGASWLMRFTVDGEIDHSFGELGVVLLAPVGLRGPLVVLHSGHILATGVINGESALVAKYRLDGCLEPAFGSGGYVTFVPVDGRPAMLQALALQSDGKLVAVGGIGIEGAHTTDAVVLRLNSDGSFDNTFNGGQPLVAIELGIDSGDAKAVAIQTDGKIVVGGQTAGLEQGVLFRLERSGALDHSFGFPSFDGSPEYMGWTHTVDAGFFEQVSRLAFTSDGNLLVLGTTRLYVELPFERQYISKYLL
ncbi:hypothetical protein BK652_14780 [Pseudomonas brassicacearum]|uniref:Delta-60 repeat domain-containing protein n=1 Tax=Pseudomonas brassicacearum TaxID=930166 RepID=A0A423G6J9_9PSED|nr:hypothetical protein BK652_14780 [Pseudomonas brassicacearum]